MLTILIFCVFFFKQKTAYEMRISDWSSDVCSSDLAKFGEMIEIMAQKVPFGVAPVLDSQRTDQKITVVPPWPTTSHYLPVKPEALTIRQSITVTEMCIAMDEATGSRTLLVRSEARRVGNASVRTCRSRWSPYH